MLYRISYKDSNNFILPLQNKTSHLPRKQNFKIWSYWKWLLYKSLKAYANIWFHSSSHFHINPSTPHFEKNKTENKSQTKLQKEHHAQSKAYFLQWKERKKASWGILLLSWLKQHSQLNKKIMMHEQIIRQFDLNLFVIHAII